MPDPIKHAENFVREFHDSSGKYTRPVLRRYPLLFGFLVIFSLAAILHGFELLTEKIIFFDRHPSALILIGILTLLLTGMLYKTLERHNA